MSYDFLKVAIFFDKKAQTFENNTFLELNIPLMT